MVRQTMEIVSTFLSIYNDCTIDAVSKLVVAY